jgi:pimeloyl-ACP methyl ester carboxylesterase
LDTEVGLIDIPACIDYITAATGAKSVGYVGHSEGTTAGFVAASQSSAKGKINSLVMLAPVANITMLGDHQLFKWLVKLGESAMYTTMGRKEFLEQTPFLKKWGPEFCHLTPKLCQDILFLFCGFTGGANFNTSHFEVYYAHTPCGTSIENMGHWIQLAETGRYAMYDFRDKSKNIEHYGQPTPPNYNLADVVAPVSLFSGGKDPLATPSNIRSIIAQLRTPPFHHAEPEYEHMDFTWGINAKDRIYPLIIQQLRKGLEEFTKL